MSERNENIDVFKHFSDFSVEFVREIAEFEHIAENRDLSAFFAAQNALDRLKIVVSDANHTLSDSGEEMEFLQRRLEQME